MSTECPEPGAATAGSDCDLVMKGGITSGVIYPRLVSALSKRYRFRNIGGTSAGAIAAGACAAAEYRRATQGSTQGFSDLEVLPALLNDKSNLTGRSKLFTLFQPTPALRRHFAVLQSALNTRRTHGAIVIALGMLKMHWPLVLLGLLAGGLLLAPMVFALVPGLQLGAGVAVGVACMALAGFCAARAAIGLSAGPHFGGAVWLLLLMLLPALLLWAVSGWSATRLWAAMSASASVVAAMVAVFVLVAVALRFAKGLLAGMHANGYGCCSGQTPDDGNCHELPALTDWLTGYFNSLAGLPEGGDPLTFGHLWGSDDPKAPRQINFEVMTSAVSQQMIYSIPFRDGTPTFYYDPVEWKRLFPKSVTDWLDKALAANPGGDTGFEFPAGVTVQNTAGRALMALPRRADLPVVVAVRMSLSFPVLLSAVPLYSIDWSRRSNRECKDRIDELKKAGQAIAASFTATKIWFSDGGIGSNMPLHMFDSLLPSHPTFAVNLKPVHPDYPIADKETGDNSGGRIHLPTNNISGTRHWMEPADGKPLGGLLGFLMSIVNTMQNWRDEILFNYPGFRDRIVQVSQRAHEGGLNLDMRKESIDALANAGALAAERLINRFHAAGTEGGTGWTNHELVRLRTFLGIGQPAIVRLSDRFAQGPWKGHIASIQAYDKARRLVAEEFVNDLEAAGAHGKDRPSLERGAMKPLAQLRITPRI
jgi:predicted acylesterase/phospholipase RssA